tara:strand:+ start:7633 stop:7929 length:297 start_codon:yes stop_codon:yes gene_type:complete
MKPEHNEEYENFTQILGGNLKFIRLKNYKPQKSLAFALGVSHQNVQKYESGEIVPGAFRLKKIAEFYGVKTDDLISPTYIYEQTKENEPLSRSMNVNN